MPGTGVVQHRGPAVPSANGLLQRILVLEQALGFQGTNNQNQSYFTATDAAGNKRVYVGYLPNGDYGILLRSPLGNTQELKPFVSGYYAGSISTTNATFTTLSDFGTLNVDIGASGDALVTISAIMNNATASTAARVGLNVNGTGASVYWLVWNQGTGGLNLSLSVTRQLSLVTGTYLTPGTNTFALQYESGTSGDTANFENISLVVQPI